MSKNIRGKAFTLAETLITLTVLGIIAMITVPALISKHVESANRTKVKKAMSVYDTAINKMVIENGIKDNNALISTAGNADNNCAGSSTYFKISQGSGCEFKTSDGLWWNVEDITHPYIAFKKEDLTAANAADPNNNNAFYLVGRIDETTGILRVNDYIAGAGDNKTYLTKLYNFVYPPKSEDNGSGSGSGSSNSYSSGYGSGSGSGSSNSYSSGYGSGSSSGSSNSYSSGYGSGSVNGLPVCKNDMSNIPCVGYNGTAAFFGGEGSAFLNGPECGYFGERGKNWCIQQGYYDCEGHGDALNENCVKHN